ncbi:MAG: autotransporter outer membrane beta-barrel domain-containing protein, partial [Planctomycetes bacterium]|nr:autotransporter outer membrane beta-barrel domain-containing protein [Planctomycetota bacterium]
FVDLLNERLTGNFDGDEFAAYVEASRNFDLNPKLRLAPLASLQYTYLTLDSYTETGGASALTFDEQTQESIRGSLGARLTQRIAESTGDFYADLQVRGRWVHEFGDDRSSVESAFVSDPTVVFTVRDGKTSRDSAILGTGLSAQLNEHAKVYVDYDARLNSDETVQVISASLQYRW